MKMLKLAKDLSLPVDAVTQTFLVVGKRGSGKSNTAARFVEQLHHAKLPFVVLDPVDTWWGLKAGLDGGKGLDVYVFGGRKQDLPLNATDGTLIADVLCEHRVSMVLSVKHLSGRERSAFMVAFAQTLFQKWGGGPLHVVLEEAHELAPQMSGGRGGQGNQDNEAAMLGAFKRLWKLGRSSGIGGTAVTQRPASLSKDITTQSEILIAHRTIGPQDVAAIGAWVKYHGEQEEILGELPSLPTGEAFIWAPEFPEGKAIGLKRTSILLRETYDSASTPKVGEQRVEPKELAPVDLERLRAKMATTIEKAKADDPKELKRQIAELRKEMAAQVSIASKHEKASPAHITEPRAHKDVLTAADRQVIENLNSKLAALIEALRDGVRAGESITRDNVAYIIQSVTRFNEGTAERTKNVLNNLAAALEQKGVSKVLAKLEGVAVAPAAKPSPATRQPVAGNKFKVQEFKGSRVPTPTSKPAAVGDLPPGEVATLTAALQYEGLDRKRLAILTGYKRSSRDQYIARLAKKGLVDVQGQQIFPTDAGRAALNGSFEPLPTGQALIDYWRDRLPEGERKVLDVLIEHGGHDVDRDSIDEVTGYKRSSRDQYLVRLKARGVVEFAGRGMVRASAELFE